MRTSVLFLTRALGLLVLFSHHLVAQPAPASLSLIPKPRAVAVESGRFTLTADTTIVADDTARPAAQILAQELSNATGWTIGVVPTSSAGNQIRLRLDPAATQLGDEGYILHTTATGVEITAPQYAGIFNGTRTLLQLFPAKIFSDRPANDTAWTLPAVRIEDQPRFPWRGMMLDVSRHFLDKEFVMRYLDIMAAHKLNVLHFHFIDDPGWRIEIKKYPKLTQIGAFRGEGPLRQGGFYTQEEMKEILAYAAARNITIVPEVEMPAHSLASTAAYPWLSCEGKSHAVPTTCYISDVIYCPSKDTTWEFIYNVLDEICEIFPSRYIHIGGDEVKYTKWKACPLCQAKIKELGLKNERELHGWMTQRVEAYLKKKGRIILGWDEILRAGASPTSAIMPWHDPKAAFDGAKNGHPVVLALTRHTYFDTTETRDPGEPPGATWLPAVSLSHAYNWEPMPAGLTPEQQKNILGAQGCLWTDRFMHNRAQLAEVPVFNENRATQYVEYLTLPRAAALAEVAWTPAPQRDWQDFQHRLNRQYARYAAAGWHHRLPEPRVSFAKTADGKILATATTPVEGATLRYTDDGTWPLPHSLRYATPVPVAKESDFLAITVGPDGRHVSLPFKAKVRDMRFDKYGEKIGEWKTGQVGNKKPRVVEFDVTGKIDRAGTYQITFIYTGGRQRLDIDWVEVYLHNDRVARDAHHGTTGSRHENNTYTLKVERYETGAPFKVKAAIYGDEGTDSNGVVLLKRVE